MKGKKIFYIKDIKEIEVCGNIFLSLTGSDYVIPFETKPTKGVHSLKSCNNCKEHHKLLIAEFKEDFANFPFCCEYHKNLTKLKVFNKGEFKDFVVNTANKIMFSYHHIINNIALDDWFKDIKDYIEYTVDSYGSMPTDCGEPLKLGNYFQYLLHLLNVYKRDNFEEITKSEFTKRIAKVKNHLKGYLNPPKEKETDLNLLLGSYNKWFKIFPFDLIYFRHLKEKYKKTIPILNGKNEYNKYTGLVTVQICTKESLTQFLLDTTKSIITNINGAKHFKEGTLSNIEKVKLDLIFRNRELELTTIEEIDNSDRQGYIKVLKKWFKGEKQFIKDITPYLNNNTSTSNSLRPNRTDIAYYSYYTSQTKTLIIENIFPSDKAWIEIGKLFNRNAKNIQHKYNSICLDKQKRLNKSKIQNLNYVIDNMLKDNKKALELAKDELKLAQLNS